MRFARFAFAHYLYCYATLRVLLGRIKLRPRSEFARTYGQIPVRFAFTAKRADEQKCKSLPSRPLVKRIK